MASGTSSYNMAGSSEKGGFVDLERGEVDAEYTWTDSAMRWGFIRKVYGIISFQLVITAAVASVFVFVEPVKMAVLSSTPLMIVAFLLPLLMLIPLYCYRHLHPLNLVLLVLWTATLSVGVGTVCSLYQGAIIFEALALTAAVVIGLTMYTFWAIKRGQDFSFMGPMLFAGLIVLVVWGFIQVFFPMGPAGRFIYALVGALLFSMYIVYDTDQLMTKYTYDEYVWASVGLYLDIINLFLKMLEILRYLQGGGGN